MNKTNRYASYLLRLWRDTDTGPWRATLVGQSGQTRSFADPARLLAFLRVEMEDPSLPAQDANPVTDQAQANGQTEARLDPTVNVRA